VAPCRIFQISAVAFSHELCRRSGHRSSPEARTQASPSVMLRGTTGGALRYSKGWFGLHLFFPPLRCQFCQQIYGERRRCEKIFSHTFFAGRTVSFLSNENILREERGEEAAACLSLALFWRIEETRSRRAAISVSVLVEIVPQVILDSRPSTYHPSLVCVKKFRHATLSPCTKTDTTDSTCCHKRTWWRSDSVQKEGESDVVRANALLRYLPPQCTRLTSAPPCAWQQDLAPPARAP
jgi:hypothetical protein